MKEMKARKVCILWSFLTYQVFLMKKNMHGNKNEDFFSICYSCPSSRCIISP